MRFKTFILQESVNKATINSLKKLITTYSNKSTTSDMKRKSGVVFFVSSIGSWPIFRSKFVDKLNELHYKVLELDDKNIKVTHDNLIFWVKYEKGDVGFYVTSNKKLEEPEWTDEEEKEEAPKEEPKSEEDVGFVP